MNYREDDSPESQIVPDADGSFREQKLDKADASVNYRYAQDPAYTCGNCRHYQPSYPQRMDLGGGCELVEGDVRAVDTCSRWEPRSRGKEAKKAFAESYGETIGDSKFPEPRDPWTTGETEGHDHQFAAAAVEELAKAGWRPTGKSALVWNHPRLKGHEIEIESKRWFHKVAGLVSHVGEHSKLADHVRSASRIYKIAEANRSFNKVYED